MYELRSETEDSITTKKITKGIRQKYKFLKCDAVQPKQNKTNSLGFSVLRIHDIIGSQRSSYRAFPKL